MGPVGGRFSRAAVGAASEYTGGKLMKRALFRSVLVAVTLLLVTETAFAVNVRGVPSCGKWVKDRQERDVLTTTALEHWLVGYLSGLAIGLNREFFHKDGVAVDNESILLWMDNYCRANPLKDVQEGGNRLMRERTNK
jgi:hypothetical protein